MKPYRSHTGVLVWAALFLLARITNAAEKTAQPEVIAGWDRHDGRVLVGELGCVACHPAGSAADRVMARQAPVLRDVGARVTPQYLRAFLADPHKVKPGTPMPDLLHALPERDRQATVEALVHYLASLGGPIDQKGCGASKVQIERGQEVYHMAGCVACHQPFTPPPKHKKDPAAAIIEEDDKKVRRPETPSVPLGDLGRKTTVDALARFLTDPLTVRPSGRMPSLGLSPTEARALAAFLLRDQYTEGQSASGNGLDFTYYEGGWNKVPDFDRLKPKKQAEARAFDLSLVPRKGKRQNASNFAVRFQGQIDIPQDGKYRFWTRSDDGSVLRIDGKLVVNNDGLHPPGEKEGQVSLRKGKHATEVGMFQGGGGFELSVLWQPPGAKTRGPVPAGILFHETPAAMIPRGVIAFTVDQGKARRGKELFASLGCAACHAAETDRVPPAKAVGLTQLNPSSPAGCLGKKVAPGRPKFAISDRQREALRQTLVALKAPAKPLDAQARLDHAMSAFNCYACHARGPRGGPDRSRADYFTYEVVADLGDEGRLPPALNGVGARLTPAGFEDALLEARRYRTYMATRMPRFGRDNVRHLPELFARADAGKVPPRKPPFSRKLVEEGRLLVGNKALGCFNCHAWGELRGQGAESVDLLQTTRRIQPGWFHALLQNPQQFRQGTRMPAPFPEGKSPFASVLGGDAGKQSDAIWDYLRAGQKGGPPPGLSPNDSTLLVPAGEPITFRTFLDGVSAHAILVGFPQRTHLVFDANRVRSVLTWTGDFIGTKAAWEGRAGQYAHVPALEAVRFPDGPPLARLDNKDSAWPADVARSRLGSNRTPPGWRFLGYRFDAKRVPTFRYQAGAVSVEETPGTDIRPGSNYLSRHFRLGTDQDIPNLYLRVAAGKKIVEKDGTWTVDEKVRYRVQAGPGVKPLVRTSDDTQELIVPVRFTPATGGKTRTAELTIELNW
jgi:cytochrome c551/c552